MDLITAIKTRRSVRKYTKDKIPHDVLIEIVDAARYSPSWKNSQIVRYHIIEDENLLKELSDVKCVSGLEPNARTVGRAAAVAVLTFEEGVSGFDNDGSYSTDKGDRWQMFDAGIAAQTFCLAALEKGIGTVILGYYAEDEIRKRIYLPESQQIAAVIPMGYPDKIPACPQRMEISDILTIV